MVDRERPKARRSLFDNLRTGCGMLVSGGRMAPEIEGRWAWLGLVGPFSFLKKGIGTVKRVFYKTKPF
jgi:hypothetical protein